MIVVRSYTVMHHLVVEITCWHGGTPQESHLLHREQVESDGSAYDVLEGVSEVLVRCARRGHQGDLELTDDCTG